MYRLVAFVLLAAFMAGCSGKGGSVLPPQSVPAQLHRTAATGGFEQLVLQNNPTQYFELEETACCSATNIGSSGSNGTYTPSNVTYSQSGPLQSESSTAIGLPGNTGSAAISMGALLPNPSTRGAFTVEDWVYPIFAPGNGRNAYYTIWGYNGSHRLLVKNQGTTQGQLLTQFGGTNFTSTGKLTGGAWNQVVFVYDGTKEYFYINGALDSALTKTGVALSAAYYVGQYDTGYWYKFDGRLGQHMVFTSALPASVIANQYTAAVTQTVPTPTPPPATYSDWNTFGGNLARWGYNPNETTLTSQNIATLHVVWKQNLGQAINAEPLVATGVTVNGTVQPVLYVGAENGVFYALNADTGNIVWQHTLGAQASHCVDLPQFGITGTATYDKTTNRVYVADGNDQVHALDMSTGQEVSGWPVTVSATPTQDHIYGALSFNPNNGLLYVETGSFCETPPWHGRIMAINTSTGGIVSTFYPANASTSPAPYDGGGIWGMGGAAIDISTNNVYVATGNADNQPGGSAPSQTSGVSDAVVQFDSNLNLLSSTTATIVEPDQDFGATPTLYQLSGCPQQLSVKSKSGYLYTESVGSSLGLLQVLQMATASLNGAFIGVPAFDPVTNLVYVGDPTGAGVVAQPGLVALQGCGGFGVSFDAPAGPSSTSDDNDAVTVANGVVYFTAGIGKEVFAFDASSGQQLWNSGSTIEGLTFGAPTVDGRLYVGSWDGNLYAFSP